ncbi:hypothetical protein AYI69_g3626 [Smittium culicis]|uniref:Uncharacterized protein n=1 Tax=Smittium culicis TaxID=133412 RepID=A0A1R1YJ94_9FUNG|nr:hypothetical protein AYI69_g3626 [Smittium culicis]
MYSGLENEIHEESFPEIDDLPSKSKGDNYSLGSQLKVEQVKKITRLLEGYEKVFANTENDIIGIKESEIFLFLKKIKSPFIQDYEDIHWTRKKPLTKR